MGLAGASIILVAVGMTAWGHYLMEENEIYAFGLCGTPPIFNKDAIKEGQILYHRGEVLEAAGPWLLGAGCIMMAIGLWTVWRPVVAERRSRPT